jgi:4-amino-4-deoxy-L-arabinose transferase-like glycosyltransferase
MLKALPRTRRRGALLGAALLVTALRLPLLRQFAFPDEGGALLVARSWHSGGPGLYGSLFLDRPPLLLLFWRVADALGGIEAARWLAFGGVVLLVLVAGWAGHQLGGRRGARWSALVAGALASTPLLGGQEVNGELIAAPLVMASCALMLAALGRMRAPTVRAVCAFGAGLAGASALLVKQDIADGLVFALALLVVAAVTRGWPRRAGASMLVAGALGVVVPLGATVLWAATRGPGLGLLWYTLYGFRADAAAVIADHSMSAPDSRMLTLAGVAMLSGRLPLLAAYLWLARHRLREREPVAVALLAMLAVEVLGVALGGSYWPHYLIAFVPAAALAAGSMSDLLPGRGLWARSPAVLVVASALVATLVAAWPFFASSRSGERALVAWLEVAHRPGDTAIVTYGHPNIIEASGLRPSGYPYLWSLPLRTLDPHLLGLKAAVSGSSAPTWLVESIAFDAWDIDPHGSFAAGVTRHYREVAKVCGVPVFLHDGVRRALPGLPPSC